MHLISWNDEIIPNWSNNTLSFVTIIYRIFIENVGYIICVLVSLSLSLSMFDRSILVSRAFLKFTARRMRSRRAERWKLELKARSLHRVYSVKEKYIKLRVAMYARNLQFSANCIRFKLISIFCTQKGIDSDFLDSIVPFSAKIRRKERSSKLASRKTAKDSFIFGRGEGGGERRGKSGRLELLSRLPSFPSRKNYISRRLVSRLSPVARRPFATEILPSLKCKVSENKGKQDGGARVLWQFPPLVKYEPFRTCSRELLPASIKQIRNFPICRQISRSKHSANKASSFDFS